MLAKKQKAEKGLPEMNPPFLGTLAMWVWLLFPPPPSFEPRKIFSPLGSFIHPGSHGSPTSQTPAKCKFLKTFTS